MTEAYVQLLDQVQLVRRLWRTRRILEGSALTAAAVVGMAAAVTVLDRLVGFGSLGRWTLAAVLWSTLIGSFWRWVVQPAVASHTDDYFAALWEERTPCLGSRLINALQLGRQEDPPAPRLIEAIVADGAAAAYDADPG
jgi:hypothetical protein